MSSLDVLAFDDLLIGERFYFWGDPTVLRVKYGVTLSKVIEAPSAALIGEITTAKPFTRVVRVQTGSEQMPLTSPSVQEGSAFWMVWSPQGNPPRYQHPNADAAKAEAERLARANPGQEFFVLEAVSVSKRVDVETRSLRKSDDPFSEY